MASTETTSSANGGKKKSAAKKRAKARASGAKNGARDTNGKVRATRKKEHGSKTDFIRRHPELSPMELAEAARAEGLKIKADYVSTVRSKDKSDGKTTTAKRKPGRPKAATPEKQFRDLIIHFGVGRAAELLEQFRAKLDAIALS